MTHRHPLPPITRRLTSGLTAVLLTAAGLLAAPTAFAATPPTTTAEITEVSATDGVTVHVTGTDYTDLPTPTSGAAPAGVYAAVIDAATTSYEDVNADTTAATLAVAFLPIATGTNQPWAIQDGSFVTDLVIAPSAVSADSDLDVIVWVAHGNLTDGTQIFSQTLALTDDQLTALADGATTAPTTDAPTSEDTPTTTARPTKGTKSGKTAKSDPPKKTKGSTSASSVATPSVQCTTETVPANLGTPRLSWGVKGSFLGYIDSNLADGTITTGGGAVWNGSTVTWGTGSGSLSSDGLGTLTFPGTLHLTGHGGILDLTISNLTVRSTGGKAGTLRASISSSDMQGNPVSAAGDLATLDFSSLGQKGGTAAATLTANGASAFAGFYSAGESLDPLTISFAGSSPATTVQRCTDADGNLVSPDGTRLDSLASTGLDTSGMTLVAGGLLLAGLSLLLLGRRETARH